MTRPAPRPVLGWHPEGQTFRLLAPRADAVELLLSGHPQRGAERVVPMQRGPSGAVGCWEVREPNPLRYYRFRVHQDGQVVDIADPRARAVARQFALGHPTWAVAQETPYDWQGDVRPGTDVAHAVIEEVHVRDFTTHVSSRVRHPGTYLGLCDAEPGAAGGLAALRDLGVNTVELMPVAAFPYLEPSEPDPAKPGVYVNPTGVNHWGYMPSFFFAPSERYATFGCDPQPGEWIGVQEDGTFLDPGVELKEMVRQLHRAGIAVVLDVVLNHISTEDNNPLFLLDPGSWLCRMPDGSLRSDSGCGNDLHTSDPDMRALCVDAIRHWMREYHVDGFRLDLAALIDDDTLIAIRQATTDIYARAILISEPWSLAGYRLGGIADLGHTVWNDRFRNGLKGHDPTSGKGFLFGAWQGGATRAEVAALLTGWERQFGGGVGLSHLSLNYLESHDNYTLGDFIRLALGEVRRDQKVGRPEVTHLTPAELRLHKLAAAALLLSRGSVMIAQGQEWGRAKVQAGGRRGYLDGNSYNRDDATNHLDWRERVRNVELVDHYRRLIQLRKEWLLPAFAADGVLHVLAGSREFALGYTVLGPRGRIAVLLNATPDASAWFDLPGGAWWLLHGAEDGQIVPVHGGVAVRVARTAAVVLYCA